MTENHGKFVWYDAMTTDPNAAAAFYKEAIGWTSKDSGMPGMTYLLLSAGGTDIGGLMPMPTEPAAAGAPPTWLGYIEVDDVDEYAAKIKASGGSIKRGPTDIPGIGRFAVASDPHGATFCLFKGAGGQMPAPVAPNTPGYIGWAELHSGDLETAWPFYTSMFGWTSPSEMDMGPMGIYRMFATGGEMPVGGMMTKMPQTPAAMWLYYFNVESLDAAMERSTKAGGSLIMGPQEVPGPLWVAQFLDPQGAMFAIVAPTR